MPPSTSASGLVNFAMPLYHDVNCWNTGFWQASACSPAVPDVRYDARLYFFCTYPFASVPRQPIQDNQNLLVFAALPTSDRFSNSECPQVHYRSTFFKSCSETLFLVRTWSPCGPELVTTSQAVRVQPSVCLLYAHICFVREFSGAYIYSY